MWRKTFGGENLIPLINNITWTVEKLRNIYAFAVYGRKSAICMQILIQTCFTLSWKSDSIHFTKYLVIYLDTVTKSVLIKNGCDGESRCSIDRSATFAKPGYQRLFAKTNFHVIWMCLSGRQPVSVLSLPLYISLAANAERLMWHRIALRLHSPMEICDIYKLRRLHHQTARRWNEIATPDRLYARLARALACTIIQHESRQGEHWETDTGQRTKANTLRLHFMALILAFLWNFYDEKLLSLLTHKKYM